MTFDGVYKITDTISHETAFNRDEAQALYDLLIKLPNYANVVEIGVQYGRSASIIGIVAKEKAFNFVAVDNYKEDVSQEAKANVENVLIKEMGLPIRLWTMDSSEAAQHYGNDIYLIHIDGDHTYKGVMSDMVSWLPKVCIGGIVCFDDYGHDSLPDVYKAVSDYMEEHKDTFKFIGSFGNKFGVFERIK